MDCLSELRRTRKPVDRATVSHVSGVYAWFLRNGGTLPGLPTKTGEPIYIGRAKNLAVREFANHLSPDATGWSTLRRSLGALMKDELALVAIHRGSSSSDSNCTNYRFEPDGEKRLTEWMLENLEVGICPADDPVAAEKALLETVRPVLNLTACKNPHSKTVKALRRACADEARRGGCA